jgi:hypothetical protein
MTEIYQKLKLEIRSMGLPVAALACLREAASAEAGSASRSAKAGQIRNKVKLPSIPSRRDRHDGACEAPAGQISII